MSGTVGVDAFVGVVKTTEPFTLVVMGVSLLFLVFVRTNPDIRRFGLVVVFDLLMSVQVEGK